MQGLGHPSSVKYFIHVSNVFLSTLPNSERKIWFKKTNNFLLLWCKTLSKFCLKLFYGPVVVPFQTLLQYPFNPATPEALFCLRFSWFLDMLFAVGNWTLCILPKIFKMFFQLINDYKEEKKCFYLMLFSYFWFNFIVLYIILKLRPPQTQTFLKCWNILSGSRDIEKRKKSKNS